MVERQLSDEEVTAIEYALLLATGNDAITSQIRNEAAGISARERSSQR
jgi:Flp pilus assembly pilin Flp